MVTLMGTGSQISFIISNTTESILVDEYARLINSVRVGFISVTMSFFSPLISNTDSLHLALESGHTMRGKHPMQIFFASSKHMRRIVPKGRSLQTDWDIR